MEDRIGKGETGKDGDRRGPSTPTIETEDTEIDSMIQNATLK